MRAHFFVHFEKGHDFVVDSFERSRFKSVVGFDGIAVHWVGNPQHVQFSIFDGGDESREVFSQRFGAHSRDKPRDLPGTLSGFKCFTKETTPSPSDLSEILIPIGLEMPLKYSMCAPSGWRVRSPHHKKCAERNQKSFLWNPIESRLLRAPKCKASWAV